MKRAAFLAGTAAMLGATHVPRAAAAPQKPPVRKLTPVAVSLDSVTRTTVGLRPYRPAGFVLRAEALDRQTLIHNYGHGGGGMSLSWGTALQARALALATPRRNAAVLGCGVIGLSTARVLQDAGFAVTIYARDVPPQTTSNLSGAQWTPTSVYEGTPDPAFLNQFTQAAELAQRRFQTYLGDDYGVRWIENYDCYDVAGRGLYHGSVHPAIRHLYPEVVEFDAGEHPFPTRFMTRFLTMLIEPNRYLRALLRDYHARGGTVVIRELTDRAQIRALTEDLVVNCTGLGARDLFADAALEPVRGQLSVLAPQPQVDYITLAGPVGYMFPRSDGIVLGGTFQHGNWSTEPDAETEKRIVAGHRTFFTSMRAATGPG